MEQRDFKLAELEAEKLRLAAQVEKLQRDKERLDWYEKFGAIKYSTTTRDGKPGTAYRSVL